jgi:CBS domain-containing protein
MRVKEIMTFPVVTCSMDCHLNEVTQLMWEHDCGSIPIVDRDGRLTGIVTDRDVCMAAYTKGAALRDIPIETAMARHVLVCHIDDSVETAQQLMREGQVRRIPVVDNDGRVAGILSMNDVARAAAQARRSSVDREVIETVAAVCAPRTSTEHRSNAVRA